MSLDGRKYRGIVAWRAAHRARVEATAQAYAVRREASAKAARKARKAQVQEEIALREKQVAAELLRQRTAPKAKRKRLHKVRV